jgi:type III restriction enzyme
LRHTIAHLDGVEFWVRNLKGEPEASFWIQTSSDKFYPDFVCKLKSGKILVVKCKGTHLAGNPDTEEKQRLGELWAERSGGKCVFLMAKGPKDLSRIQDTVAANTSIHLLPIAKH